MPSEAADGSTISISFYLVPCEFGALEKSQKYALVRASWCLHWEKGKSTVMFSTDIAFMVGVNNLHS